VSESDYIAARAPEDSLRLRRTNDVIEQLGRRAVAAAAAMTEAGNLRVDQDQPLAGAPHHAFHSQLEVLASDLASIQTSLSLLSVSRQGGLPQKVGVDLIASQTSRAAWLVSSMLGTFEDSRLVPLGAIVQRVTDSFDAHATLIGLQLECYVTASAAVWQLPEDSTNAAIRGAVFAALSSLEDVAKPCVELHADSAQAGKLTVDVIQRAVRVSPAIGGLTAHDRTERADEVIPALALRIAKSVTAAHGGTAELTPLPGAGSLLRMIFLDPNSRV
jgi:hypothetical protein